MEIFLGGTCNGSVWRGRLTPLLDRRVDYFDPVVADWNEEAQKREIEKRETCDFVLYVITPRMTGVYSIAEVVDDSNKRSEKTLFCFLDVDGDAAFSSGQLMSLRAVGKMVQRNGGTWLLDLEDVARYVNWRANCDRRESPRPCGAESLLEHEEMTDQEVEKMLNVTFYRLGLDARARFYAQYLWWTEGEQSADEWIKRYNGNYDAPQSPPGADGPTWLSPYREARKAREEMEKFYRKLRCTPSGPGTIYRHCGGRQI